MARSSCWSTYDNRPPGDSMHKSALMTVQKRSHPEAPQAKRQLPLFPYNTGGRAGRYADSLIAWWSAAGGKAPARRPQGSEPDAEKGWEEEGGKLLRRTASSGLGQRAS